MGEPDGRRGAPKAPGGSPPWPQPPPPRPADRVEGGTREPQRPAPPATPNSAAVPQAQPPSSAARYDPPRTQAPRQGAQDGGQPPWGAPAPAQPEPGTDSDPEPAAFEQLSRRVPHGDPWLRRVGRGLAGAGSSHQTGERTQLAQALQRPVTTGRRIAVMSVRGGAGKSTVSALVGSVLARHRSDRVLVVDGDPDLGSVATRLGVEQALSLRALFGSGGQPRSFDQLGPYLRQSPTGLWVLSGRREVAVPTADASSFGYAQPVLSRYFAISLVDCGAGLYSELTTAVLARVHGLVLAVPATADGVWSGRQALDQLAQTAYRPLLARSVLALVAQTHEGAIDLRTAVRTLSAYGVRVLQMPYDRHLAAGARIDLGRVSDGVRDFTLRAGAEALFRSTWS